MGLENVDPNMLMVIAACGLFAVVVLVLYISIKQYISNNSDIYVDE